MPKNGASACARLKGRERATLLRAGSEVPLTADEIDVRREKVESAQSALKAGTYQVPASAVAAKVLDEMLVL